MKITLINAPKKKIKVEPLGLEYLVSILKSNNIDVMLIDATIEGLDEEEFVNILRKIDPDMIGISMTTMGLIHDLNGLSLAKKACPNAKIVVGGPHPSAAPIELMKSVKDIDFVVIGEGEMTIVELMNALGNSKNKNLGDIKGIAFRSEDGSIKLTQPRELIKDLDSIPIPSREFIDFKKVKAGLPFGRRKPFSIMMTSRGCPCNCIYCSKPVFGRKYRHRSVGNIIEEIEYLILIGIKEIRFYDDIFTMIPKNTIKLCDELMKRKFDLMWSCGSRVDRISKEMLIKMKNAGCYHISYGVESGSQKVLDTAKRGMKVNHIREAFKMTREVGLEVSAFLMFGLPGETEKTLKDTSSLIKDINPDFISASLVGIYPKTELYEIARSEKLIGDIDWCNFTDRKASPLAVGSMMQYVPKDLTHEELEKFFKRFYWWYYLYPMRVYRTLRLIKNPEMLYRGGRALFSYVLH
jgi:radical SAM superfamily enzyme YgiQ (UPF0313 family)